MAFGLFIPRPRYRQVSARAPGPRSLLRVANRPHALD
jgi:hypothetical protein